MKMKNNSVIIPKQENPLIRLELNDRTILEAPANRVRRLLQEETETVTRNKLEKYAELNIQVLQKIQNDIRIEYNSSKDLIKRLEKQKKKNNLADKKISQLKQQNQTLQETFTEEKKRLKKRVKVLEKIIEEMD